MTPRRKVVVAALSLLVPIALIVPLVARDTHESAGFAASTHLVLQMNLCLSGRAGCYSKVDYPRGVRQATDLIRTTGADAVTLNEVCRSDVDDMAAATGLQVRFAAVASYVLPDDCIEPGGRGVFGIAVLTRARVNGSTDRPYTVQDERSEQRRWLCVTTDAARVCTTHLEIRGQERLDATNDAQCSEFGRLLAGLPADRPLIAGGDMNRDGPCSAPGMWVTTDRGARQAPGKQHVYATASFGRPRVRILPLSYTDHDALAVSGRLDG